MTEAVKRKVSVVTGGSRGIGRAVVEGLLAEGHRVHFCGRTAQGVDFAMMELQQRWGSEVEGQAVDVRHSEDVESWIDSVISQSRQIDCLVNNAGIGAFEPVDEMSPRTFRRVIETNLCGAFYCINAVAPLMRQQGSGWIVNVASLAARNPIAGGAAYNASKFGLLGLSDAAMLDLRSAGVKVAAVLPGSVASDFEGPGGEGGADWKLTPQDVARAVVDLLRYPDRALPSRVELRPSRPGGR